MKKTMIWSLILLFSVLACEKQPVDNSMEKIEVSPEEIVFTGAREAISPATRTTPVAGGAVNWTADDEIGVWDGTNYVKATTVSVSGSSITFRATVDAGASEYVIVSPYECGKPSGSFAIDGSGNVTLSSGGAAQSAGTQVVSVAKVTTPGTPFTFKNVGNLLRFKVEKAGVVKAKFTGNASEKIAGTLTVNPSTGAVVSSDLTEGEITVDVAVGEDNFIALPAGLNLASGFTITLYGDAACTDYQGEIHPATAVAFTGEKARNRMLNLGVVDGWIDNYLLWEAGKPITIAGNTYTKAGTGFSGTLLKPTDADVDLFDYLYNKEGCFFLENNGSYAFTSRTFINAGTNTADKNILLISRYDNSHAIFSPTSHINLIRGNFLCKGIDIVANPSSAYLFIPNVQVQYGNLHLDDCTISWNANKNILYASHNGSIRRGVRSIRIVNSVLKADFSGTLQLFVISNDFTKIDEFEEISLNNNLLYSLRTDTKMNITTGSATSGVQRTVFSLVGNTFYNLPPNGTYLNSQSMGGLTITDNIFSNASDPGTAILAYGTDETNEFSYLIDRNVCTNTTLKYFNPYQEHSIYKSVTATVPKTSESIFSTADPSTGTFVKAPAFAAYGANL